MNINELAIKLSEMYENAEEGNQVAMIHLFGIRYAEIIRENGFTANEILENTNLSSNYYAEINKGIRLAEFVVDKEKLRNLMVGIL